MVKILEGLMDRYKAHVPDVGAILAAMVREGLIASASDIENDHIAFRTLGVRPLGIASLEKVFLHYGYERRDRYDFLAKKVTAHWYAPPKPVFPRIFISELRVHELSSEAQTIIRSSTEPVKTDPVDALDLNSADAVVAFLHAPLWRTPTWADYQRLQQESEFAVWVIFNRYYLNHFTISIHNLPERANTLDAFNRFLESNGFTLNDSGGKAKVSADGKLLQSSTVAAMVDATFDNGHGGTEVHRIPGSYVEFAERRVLDAFAHLPASQIRREHRREGFEAASADRIFESTYTVQATRRSELVSKPQPRDAFRSPRFSQPPTFMRLPYRTELTGVDVALVGIPFDGGTSYRPGTRLGPREIRAQSSLIRPFSHFQQVAPFDRLTVVDAGDVDVSPVSLEVAHKAVEAHIAGIVAAGAIPLAIGGDHSISLPVLRALARVHGPLGLVQFDSHIDTWDGDFGSKLFHGSPFYYAVTEGLVDPRRFVQVGIRGPMYGPDDFVFQRENRITVLDIDEVFRIGLDGVLARIRSVIGSGHVYVTFDIDAVDPAFAPGTGTPEVGGLTSHEAQLLLRGLAGLSIAGGDIVEVSPPFDGPGQITSLLAANLLFELLCVIARAH
jgi:agmatinase